MQSISVTQLWGKAWDLFKVNWLVLVGLFILMVVVNFIPFIGGLLVALILSPALNKAGLMVARKGSAAFGEPFQDIAGLLKIFAYNIILYIVPVIIILAASGVSYQMFLGSVTSGEVGTRDFSEIGGTGLLLTLLGSILALIVTLLGWAGPYYILEGKAGIFDAIGKSFSLTTSHIGLVFIAFLLYILLVIVGALPCFLGLIVVYPMAQVFWPLLYLNLTGGSGTSLV